MALSQTNRVIQESTMIDPATLTVSAILVPRGYDNATLAFQEFIKSGARELAKKFTGDVIAITIILRFGNHSAVYDGHWPNRLM
jgi:hypothetical protein